MFNIAICDDEETLIGELKENLIKYAAETNKEFCFFIYHDGSVYFKEGIWFCQCHLVKTLSRCIPIRQR